MIIHRQTELPNKLNFLGKSDMTKLADGLSETIIFYSIPYGTAYKGYTEGSQNDGKTVKKGLQKKGGQKASKDGSNKYFLISPPPEIKQHATKNRTFLLKDLCEQRN